MLAKLIAHDALVVFGAVLLALLLTIMWLGVLSWFFSAGKLT